MTELYSEKEIETKAKKLIELFPEIQWFDILELVPQMMEVIEVRALSLGLQGPCKFNAVVNILNKVLDNVNSSKEVRKAIPLFIKTIDDASKGKFAINKERLL